MKTEPVTSRTAMGKSTKRSPATDRPKLQGRRDKLQATVNRRLAEQIRKVLGKQYASKYRVR
jgi:hypothetical protein